MTTLYITGAGVSRDSGIPTFRGHDGVWTIGSRHYTPQEMATRAMYMNDPAQFILWYFKRFATYRHVRPNGVHDWLAAQCNNPHNIHGATGRPRARLITQNIDGLDGKAGNEDYIAIHGRLDKMTLFHDQAQFDTRTADATGGGHAPDAHLDPPLIDAPLIDLPLIDAPWDDVMAVMGGNSDDDAALTAALLAACRIDPARGPQMNVALKPYVLLFDEYYTDLYRMTAAEEWMRQADRMVFIGTSFSVNITMIALRTALQRRIPIVVVDPDPVDIAAAFGIPAGAADITYHAMTADAWVQQQG